jgi:Gram-negative porin
VTDAKKAAGERAENQCIYSCREAEKQMRKQLLLGTTALLAGAVAMPDFVSAEEPLRLSVRGYKNEYFGIGSINNDTDTNTNAPGGTDTGNTSHFSDGEVHFKGDTTLDNGLTVGVQIELEATQNGDQIDEAYTWISGSFGKVILGSENLAPYLTFWGVTAPNVGVPINSGWISVWVPSGGVRTAFRRPMSTTNLELANDTFGVSYLSPRFGGFQFTAGYKPTSGGGGDPKNAPSNEDTENINIFAVGGNFKQSFSGVDVGVAVGYNRATVSDAANAAGANDPQQIKVGASIGVAGFTIAGSYANELEGQTNLTNTTSTEGQSYDVGVSYGMGPWGVSGTYFHGEVEQAIAVSGDDEVDAFVGAVSYALGPGITTSFSVIYAQWQDELGSGANQDSDGTMGVLGLAVGF